MRLWVLFVLAIGSAPLWSAPAALTPFIKIDQFGYLPNAQKVAVISDPVAGFNSSSSFNPGSVYQIRRWDNDSVVYQGVLIQWKQGQVHHQSGDRGWWFDFSPVNTPGRYYIYDLDRQLGSYQFEIKDGVYNQVLDQALRMFFYQRVNHAKQPPYADPRWSDKSAYNGVGQDFYATDINDPNNSATARNLSGGWFDAVIPTSIRRLRLIH